MKERLIEEEDDLDIKNNSEEKIEQGSDIEDKNIKAEDIVPYIDLSGYSAGEHEVAVEVENDDPRVEYVVTKKIKVIIK